MAFIDMGDQFIALAQGRTQPPDQARHFGLVVDDKEAVRARLKRARRAGVVGPQPRLPRPVGQPDPGRRLPRRPVHEDGRRSSAGMGLAGLEKSDGALAELRDKGLAPS